jgi:hypothetical protein
VSLVGDVGVVTQTADRSTRERRLPSVRMGLLAGATALLCCLGPTVLALLGVAGATYLVLYAVSTWLGTFA